MQFLRTKSSSYPLWAMVVIYALVAFFVPKGYPLTVFGNLAQAVLPTLGVSALLLNLRGAPRNQRLFWWCMSAGVALWIGGQLTWIYYENYLRATALPYPFLGDLVFFSHILPMLAAASLQPHAIFPDNDHGLRLGHFDFGMLLIWWAFLYGYLVAPWQYVVVNEEMFGPRYNILYFSENIVLIIAFAVLWRNTSKSWKSVYGHMCGASTLYAMSSLFINMAIDRDAYYTGSLYDVPLVTSMAWFAHSGLVAFRSKLEPEAALATAEDQAIWHARFGGAAVLSMPLFALWATMDHDLHESISHFRVWLTLGCMMLLMVLLFMKQNLLDRKLIRLLQQSREAYSNLQRLQSQLLQSEKLASMGRLVAGAAHEINNPLTAILGYSDLLMQEQEIKHSHRDMAEKIRQQARRTKNLVSNLLTFAKQSPLEMKVLDFNAVVSNALQLRELDLGHMKIQTERRLEAREVLIRGDETHLLQLCLHIFNNAVDAMAEANGGGVLLVSTWVEGDQVRLSCSDTGPGVSDPEKIFDPFYTTKAIGKGPGLGLSACYGIVRDHGGEISCYNRPEGGATFLVSFPLVDAAYSSAPLSASARQDS